MNFFYAIGHSFYFIFMMITLFFYAIFSSSTSLTYSDQTEPLDRYYDDTLEIFDSFFHDISASIIFYAPSTTYGNLNVRRSTFYQCTANKRTVFDLASNVVLTFNMLCFKEITANVEGVILDFTDTYSQSHYHKLEYLSLASCTTNRYWIIKIWLETNGEWHTAYLDFKYTNVSHSSSMDGDQDYRGIIQIRGYWQTTYQNTFADNKCYEYGLIYEKGDYVKYQQYNLGTVNHCNFVSNFDEDNTLIFADVCQLTISYCHFAGNNYGVNYAIWAYDSSITLKGNVYDSPNLCGTTQGGSFSDGGDNSQQSNPPLENFPHYANNYCEAKNRYPPTPDVITKTFHLISPYINKFRKMLIF